MSMGILIPSEISAVLEYSRLPRSSLPAPRFSLPVLSSLFTLHPSLFTRFPLPAPRGLRSKRSKERGNFSPAPPGFRHHAQARECRYFFATSRLGTTESDDISPLALSAPLSSSARQSNAFNESSTPGASIKTVALLVFHSLGLVSFDVLFGKQAEDDGMAISCSLRLSEGCFNARLV